MSGITREAQQALIELASLTTKVTKYKIQKLLYISHIINHNVYCFGTKKNLFPLLQWLHYIVLNFYIRMVKILDGCPFVSQWISRTGLKNKPFIHI